MLIDGVPMFGPRPAGFWSKTRPAEDFKHLLAGKRYTVVREFLDYDQDVHAVGETWRYLGYNFVPYHDGLSLFVSTDDRQEWQIRLQWVKEEQAAIISALETYIQPAD